MLDARTLKAEDLQGLSKGAVTEIAAALLAQLTANSAKLSAKEAAIAARDEHIAQRDREIKFKDAKIERITFELARLKAWKFGAKTEAMNAEQRKLFEDTLAEDEADLQAQLQAIQGRADTDRDRPQDKRKPRRQMLPEHLRRVEHHHEPESTTCPTPDCGQAMVRIGEDVSERLDVVPAEFFGLAGRVDPEGQPFVRHELSSGQFKSALSIATSAASGPASAASGWCKNRSIRRSSTRACRQPV